MADNIAAAGISFRRSDRSLPILGTTMRLRESAVVAGEFVKVDITSSSALTNTDYTKIDLGTATVASSPLATVILATAGNADIVGVALEDADEDALVRVEFSQGGTPTIVPVLAGDTITVGLPLAVAADSRADPAAAAGVVGKVVGRALEAGSDGDTILMLMYGNAGIGSQESTP